MLHFWFEPHAASDTICTEGFGPIRLRKISTFDLFVDKGLHRYHVVFLAGSEQREHLFIRERHDEVDEVKQGDEGIQQVGVLGYLDYRKAIDKLVIEWLGERKEVFEKW